MKKSRATPQMRCPNPTCKVNFKRMPIALSVSELGRIRAQISGENLGPLPEPVEGQRLYRCGLCTAIWLAYSPRPPYGAKVLGFLDSTIYGPGWHPT